MAQDGPFPLVDNFLAILRCLPILSDPRIDFKKVMMAKAGRRLFVMSVKEALRSAKWRREHDNECSRRHPDFPAQRIPHYTYSFSPTGIGEAVTISCHCGAKEDVTDYDSW